MRNKKVYTVDEAQQALEYFCSYQERTHKEVEQKLQSMGMIEVAKEKIITSLIQNDFLNEERFAKTYVRGKFSINKWGRIKIRQALRSKGISEANILIGFSEIDEDDYLDTLCDLADKQLPKIKAKDGFEKKQRLIRYLQQKGFEINLIYDCIKNPKLKF